MILKAIETVYKGYKFRSRLEARWAVFFDALGIEYQYEHEGFDLGKAGWYLPDFFIVDLSGKRWYLEVKPAFNLIASEDQIKIDTFQKLAEVQNIGFILLVGTPNFPYGKENEGSDSIWKLIDQDILHDFSRHTRGQIEIVEAVRAARQARF